MTTKISRLEKERIAIPYTAVTRTFVPLVALCIIASIASVPSLAQAPIKSKLVRLDIAPGSGRVTVYSRDQVEHWTATSLSLSGKLVGNPQNLDAIGTSASLVLPHNTLKSDNSSRDGHMYSMFDAATYPNATLTITSLHGSPILTAKPEAVTFDATLTLHGVTQSLSAIPATMTYSGTSMPNSGQLHLQTTFTIRLKDYRLKAPSFLFVHVADDQKIAVDFTATEVKAL